MRNVTSAHLTLFGTSRTDAFKFLNVLMDTWAFEKCSYYGNLLSGLNKIPTD
jgi:hypothetical protein